MSLRFSRLDRLAIRRLGIGDKISEHGITVERLSDGDLRYSVNVMVDGERIHRVLGRERDGVTRTQCEEFIEQAKTDAARLRSTTGRDASSLSDDGIRAGKKLETNNANSLGTEKSGEPERGDKITKSPKRPHTRLPKHPPPKSPSDLNDLVDRVPPEWRKQLGL